MQRQPKKTKLNISMNLFINLLTISVFLRASYESVVNGKSFSHNRSKRVRNGTMTAPYSNPYLGQLYYQEYYICSVFLISRPPYHHSNVEHGSSDIVITVANKIFDDMNVTDSKVSFAKQTLGGFEENQVNVSVKRAILHQEFLNREFRIGNIIDTEKWVLHDIAMLKLEQQVHFTEFVKPIALANSSSMVNCLFTGWEEKKPEFYQRKMSTVDLFNVSSWRNILRVRMSYEKQLTLGDGGAPMICNIAGQPYARGISTASNGRYEIFTDIVLHMPWILDAYKTIDHEEPFHMELDKYSAKKLTSRFVRKHLEYALKGAIGSIPANFSCNLTSQKLGNSNLSDLWHSRFIHSFVRVWHDQFCTHEIRGYVKVGNVYDCATLCLLENRQGICNYLPSLAYCHFADYGFGSRQCVEMPEQQSVAIYYDYAASISPCPFLNCFISFTHRNISEKRPESSIFVDMFPIAKPRVVITNQSGLKKSWEQNAWKVSISTVDWPNFHCLGYLTSKKRSSEYSMVTYSTECVKRLMLNASNATMINIFANLASRIVKIKIVKENECNVTVMGSRSCRISKAKKPIGYPKIFGHETNRPVLRRYSPSSGAFMSEPYAQPWITYFTTNHNEVCIGVLFSRFDLTGNGTQGTTSSLLTTATCARNINTTAGIRTSSYFLKSITPYQKVHNVGKIFIHPNFNMEDQNMDDVNTSIEFNIAIILLKNSIKSGMLAGSIRLPSNQSSPGSNLVIAAWNVNGGDSYGSLYEIPVKILRSKKGQANAGRVDKTFLTQRTYYKGNGSLDKEVHAKPLIAYKQNGEGTLIGLHVRTVVREERYFERHVALKQHIPWIERQLENRLFNDEPQRPPIKIGRSFG